jgi:hypothetical protein
MSPRRSVRRPPWRADEDASLRACAPHWSHAARRLGRSPSACRQRYRSLMRPSGPPARRAQTASADSALLVALLRVAVRQGLSVATAIDALHALAVEDGRPWQTVRDDVAACFQVTDPPAPAPSHRERRLV